MTLTIITINYNNASGLKKTMESVFTQTYNDSEYIVIDGASTDGSREVISQYANMLVNFSFSWVSESDSGIYNAMNKGIRMAKGEYLQFLNSGDCLAAPDVTARMLTCLFPSQTKFQNKFLSPLEKVSASWRRIEVGDELGVGFGADILYGNMLKLLPKRILRDRGFAGRMPTMLDFFTGTLNHSPTYIKRSLFDTYGMYDESLRIVSDWKWYLQVIVLDQIVPVYIDIDVTVFDMNGISTVNSDLDKVERKQVLSEILPASVLADYERWAFPIDQLKRINRYGLTRKGFWLVERILFKWEMSKRKKI